MGVRRLWGIEIDREIRGRRDHEENIDEYNNTLYQPTFTMKNQH